MPKNSRTRQFPSVLINFYARAFFKTHDFEGYALAFLNEQTNELHLKVLYAGCAGSGKTTNLQSLYKQTSPELSSRLFDLHEVARKNQFFDFLPMSLGQSRAHALRLHVYTLPSHDLWRSVVMNLAWGVDGVVFVLDSRVRALQENEQQLMRLKSILKCVNRNFDEIPLVFQYNQRDAPDALPLRAMKTEYTRTAAAEIEGVAVQDIGVVETVEALSDRILANMESPRFM